MWRWLLLPTVVVVAACSPSQESVRMVAAVDVPLKTSADRDELIAILRRHATAREELHVDDVTAEWVKFEAKTNTVAPAVRGTIFVGVWRGARDDEPIADAEDSTHRGRAWVTFLKGQHTDVAARFRVAVLADIARTWPDARPLPVTPSGGLPLPEDLRLTPSGYKIAPKAAHDYGVPVSSPLVARG